MPQPARLAQATLPQLFEAQARRTPQATALIHEDQRLSYAELERRANRLARLLIARGLGTEDIVALALPRTPEAIIALLAVMKCGAAYLPMDPAYPRDRLKFMLADARPCCLLSLTALRDPLDLDVPTLCLDDPVVVSALAEASDAPPADSDRLRPLQVAHAAYLIYTSGSTGRPKGVVVTHAGIGALAAAQIARFGIEPASRVLQFASLSFDAAVSEVCMALLAGAALVLAPQPRLMPGEPLARTLREAGVTHLTLPPSALAAMPDGGLPPGMALLVAGEACPPALVARWARGRCMVNAYGPTEATVCATMSQPLAGAVVPPLGAPIEGLSVHLLDACLRECAAEEPGELYLSGPGLARGYLGRPVLTAERFVACPFGPPGSRMYRTGDLACRRADGRLEFLGRTDDQVKIRGFRVEPGEVEQQLLRHAAVAQAAVVVRADPAGLPQLVGYAALASPIDAAALRADLAQRLPAHMVPAVIVLLEQLPVTPNGKIDRAALPAPRFAGPAPRRAASATEDTLQRLYAEVLGLEEVPLDESFFDLGGHSLAATRLVGKIQKALGVELELDLVYEAPSAAKLARLIEAHAPRPGRTALQPETPHLVLLQAGPASATVYCVHAVDGAVSQYRELARRLGHEAAVYGISAIDLEGRTLPAPSLQAIAADYVRELRRRQPCGPYFLAGWSSGGLLAFEMAAQLARAGDTVGGLTVLDAWRPEHERPWPLQAGTPAPRWTAPERNAQWHFFLTKFLPRFHTLAVAAPEHPFWHTFHPLDDEGKRHAVLDLARRLSPQAPQFDSAQLAYLFDVVLLQDSAIAAYRPSTYEGPIDLFVTDYEGRGRDTLAYWQQLARGPLHSVWLPGDHAAVVDPPGVAAVAHSILGRVRNALANA